MKIGDGDTHTLPTLLIEKAEANQYEKVVVKIPYNIAHSFEDIGYIKEAEIPRFYSGQFAAVILSKFLTKERKIDQHKIQNEKVLLLSQQKSTEQNSELSNKIEKTMTLKKFEDNDVHRIAVLYNTVFPSYPFPIYDPAYVDKTMKSNVDYFGIEVNGELVSLSSLEKDMSGRNAEMTDFATLPEWQGKGLAVRLLVHMEKEARKIGILTAYTIARAESPGMNIVFAKNAYQFGGRLINNSQISGHIESMNVWYKYL